MKFNFDFFHPRYLWDEAKLIAKYFFMPQRYLLNAIANHAPITFEFVFRRILVLSIISFLFASFWGALLYLHDGKPFEFLELWDDNLLFLPLWLLLVYFVLNRVLYFLSDKLDAKVGNYPLMRILSLTMLTITPLFSLAIPSRAIYERLSMLLTFYIAYWLGYFFYLALAKIMQVEVNWRRIFRIFCIIVIVMAILTPAIIGAIYYFYIRVPEPDVYTIIKEYFPEKLP